jgi:hypothetical protein
MIDENQLEETIANIENYYFGEKGDCGESLFINFAKENKETFIKAKLSQSTENNFEFTELYTQFQKLYEMKLEGETDYY